jgi:hypothetical protein
MRVINVSYSLQEASLFAQIGNSRAIIVGEHLVAEYRICNLWCMNKIHFKQAGLQMALLCFIVFEGIQ